MLFNSLSFAIFFPIVFIVYWALGKKHYKWQNVFLLIASYYFYSCWDWRFVFLLAFSTALDYYSGMKIHDAQSKASKKFWLILSVGLNLGFLGFFKYYNFFIDSLGGFWRRCHFLVSSWFKDHLHIPIGGSKGVKARFFNKIIRNLVCYRLYANVSRKSLKEYYSELIYFKILSILHSPFSFPYYKIKI